VAVSRPDFFIVGAPKCGTTALYEYLRVHPQVFMPFHKEPLFFGQDLHPRYGRMSEADYLALFAAARPGQRVGEASAWYLYSRTAAAEINAFAPGAAIIVMLRDPVEMMYAQHSQLLYNRQEVIADFAEALAAEPARRRGALLPPGPVRVENLFYRDAAHFAEQLERYYDCFGRDRVHVIVHDDLAADAPGVYRGVLEFLEVDPEVRLEFAPANVNKAARSALLQRLIYQPPGALRRAVPWLRQFPLIHRLRRALLAANSRRLPRPPLDPILRRSLAEEFEPEVKRIGELLGRDLRHWSAV
jgi:hypothetical protein